jgi:hypothetical protein
MSNCHSGKFSKTGEKCLKVIPANFVKQKENVHSSFLQIFKNGRKSPNHFSGKFSKIGGKCSTIILADFQNREEKSPTFILANFQKLEENVQLAS